MSDAYQETQPLRREIDARRGPLLLNFGNDWCGHCRRAAPLIAEASAEWPGPDALPHLKVADGPGRPLGRSFAVKLWPTVVALHDGVEVARVVRPPDAAAVRELMAALQLQSRTR